MSSEFVPEELMIDLKNNGYNEMAIVNKSVVNSKTGKVSWVRNPILLQQAFRWFRERGYLISFDTHSNIEYEYYIVYGDGAKNILSDIFSTWEEMELNCLSKLIEIHKSIT